MTKITEEKLKHKVVAPVYPPEAINITFTENDLENAEEYSDHRNCLICTAMKRMGFKGVSIGSLPMGRLHIEDYKYSYILCDDVNDDPVNIKAYHDGRSKPLYRPEVVGMTLTFVRVK